MGTIRMHVYFSGRVQGVGFRFTACRLARYLPMERFIRVDSMDTKEISLKEGERDFREIY